MIWSVPSTSKQLAVTVACLLTGGTLFSVGAYLSFVNIGPQQARTKARNDALKQQIRKMLGD